MMWRVRRQTDPYYRYQREDWNPRPPRQKLVAQLRCARIAAMVSSALMVILLTHGRTIAGTLTGIGALALLGAAADTRRRLGR